VSLSGAKNSVLRLLAATLLTEEDVVLYNYPAGLLDAQVHVGMLEKLGKTCTLINDDTISIKQSGPTEGVLNWEGRSIRNTLLILGALTAKNGFGSVPLPGGCKLGDRSFDLHEMLLRTLGAKVWQEGDVLLAEAPEGGLVGADIYLPIRSTGATENAILAGTLAKGVTKIWNPHIRPEILDLIKFLNTLGADIKVFGQEHIEVNGVECLGGSAYHVMPDNMEAITWLLGAVMTGGDVEIEHFPSVDLEVAMIHLRESGVKFFQGEDSLIVRGGCCYPIEISTGPHPGINSDVQPLLAAFGAMAIGESRIVDLRFPGRYGYAEEMSKMGVEYEIEGNLLKIQGNGGQLKGANVRVLDLRAGAALFLCGLVADGDTYIEDAWQIERGYNNFVEKARSLNAKVERVKVQ
jgi:UDP-N-acetylglucosamine 1-carboxyvinyltransferase